MSAGSLPAVRVDPYAIVVLGERGMQWADRTPKRIDALMALPLETLASDQLREPVQAIHMDVHA